MLNLDLFNLMNYFKKSNKWLALLATTSFLSLALWLKIDASIANEVDLKELDISQNNTQSDTNISKEDELASGSEKKSQNTFSEDARVPDAPALSIIGSPKIEIAKPGTPRAFGLTLFESFADSETGIPQNFALDLAPYWWLQRPLNTIDGKICRPSLEENRASGCQPISFGESLYRSLTISIASSEQDLELEGENIDLTRLGLGLRFSLLDGDINPSFKEKYKALGELQCLVDDDGERLLNPSEQQECKRKNEPETRILVEELRQLRSNRVGWQLDFALASALDFPENNFDNAEFTRLGTWLTAAYVPTNSDRQASSFTFLGIGRYIYDDFEDEGESLIDLGGRIIWSPKATPLSGSVEYLRRLGDDDSDRLVGLAEYKFNDTYSVFASFGQTFEEDFTGNEDLVTLLGINIGLGQKPQVSLPTP